MTAVALRIRDLMTTDMVTLERGETLDIADSIMNLGRIRHLPVLDGDGRLCGIVSQRDLFRGALGTALGVKVSDQHRLLRTLRIEDVMTSDLLTARPDDSLHHAAALMLKHKIGCLLVVEGDRLVGLVTESDFVRQFAESSEG